MYRMSYTRHVYSKYDSFSYLLNRNPEKSEFTSLTMSPSISFQCFNALYRLSETNSIWGYLYSFLSSVETVQNYTQNQS